MSNNLAKEWLKLDLDNIFYISKIENLTPIVPFHSQH